jgi:hypothetical protein
MRKYVQCVSAYIFFCSYFEYEFKSSDDKDLTVINVFIYDYQRPRAFVRAYCRLPKDDSAITSYLQHSRALYL